MCKESFFFFFLLWYRIGTQHRFDPQVWVKIGIGKEENYVRTSLVVWSDKYTVMDVMSPELEKKKTIQIVPAES